MRKGRLDELFFVDLPAIAEREEIFRIHLAKRGRDPREFDAAQLAALAENYSGAEIEQAIISALYDAFYAGRDLTQEDLLESLRQTVPLSRTMAEQINQLRSWARGRARSASSSH